MQYRTVFCRFKTSRRVCSHISATEKLLLTDRRIQHFQLTTGRQFSGELPHSHFLRQTCQYRNLQDAILSPCFVFQQINAATRIIASLAPSGLFQRCNRPIRQAQTKTDITAVVLDISGKYRTIAGFQTPCRRTAVESTGITVLSVNTDKILAGRQVLQRTGSSPLMVIVGSGFYQITCFLRRFRRRSILRVRTQRGEYGKNNCKNRGTIHRAR